MQPNLGKNHLMDEGPTSAKIDHKIEKKRKKGKKKQKKDRP
jgi:hypothetical protein